MKCTECGTELAPEDKFCGGCGAPGPQLRPQLSQPFAEAQQRFAALRARYQAGELDDAAYDTELQKLMVKDDAGGHWMLGADSGEWYWYDGQQWVQRAPPSVTAPAMLPPERAAAPPVAAAPAPAAPPSKKRFPWKWIALGLGGLLAVAAIAVVGVVIVPQLLSPGAAQPQPTDAAPAATTTQPTTAPAATSPSSEAATSEPTPQPAATEPAEFSPDEIAWQAVMAHGPDLEVYVPVDWEYELFEGGASPGLRDPADIDLHIPEGVESVSGVAAYPAFHDKMELEIVWYRAPEGRTAEEELDFWETQIPASSWGDKFQPNPVETVLGTQCVNFAWGQEGLRVWAIVVGPTPNGYFLGWFSILDDDWGPAVLYRSISETERGAQ